MYDVNPELNADQVSRIERELGMAAKRINAKFIVVAEFDQQTSTQVGRPIYKDYPALIEIAEGERDFMPVRATEKHKQKYQEQWQRFQEAMASPRFSVEQIPGIKPSEVCMLNDMGLRTIDAVAGMSPTPELAAVVLKAQRWLLIASGEKPRLKLEVA